MKSVSCSDKSYCRCATRNQGLCKPAIDNLSGTSHLVSFFFLFSPARPVETSQDISTYLKAVLRHENTIYTIPWKINRPFLIENYYFVHSNMQLFSYTYIFFSSVTAINVFSSELVFLRISKMHVQQWTLIEPCTEIYVRLCMIYAGKKVL